MSALEQFRQRFEPPEAFRSDTTAYQLAPFRFARIPGVDQRILIVNEVGEFEWLPKETFQRFCNRELSSSDPVFFNLRSKHFLLDDYAESFWPFAVSQYRTRKSFLIGGPALHIFVVTLRCEHSCPYCQVSRQTSGTTAFDMSDETARAAVDRMFESPSPELKVEFQGGEPLLAFDGIRRIVEYIVERNGAETRKRHIEFVIATTLNNISAEQLDYCKKHQICLSTSIDGPEHLHNRNRPRRGRDSYRRTVEGIRAAREVLGGDAVSALTTITRESLKYPEEIGNTYAELNFPAIFLRPLSPYGFARLARARIGYGIDEFLGFYDRALAHLIKLNLAGNYLEESYTTLLLQQILTPFPTGYVDLRSPAGAALGTLVYNYDGGVYASDEGRMLAETGDHTFRLGNVQQPYSEFLQSPAACALIDASIAESIPGCCDCAFLPYCGADPVFHHAEKGTRCGHRPTSAFCQKQTGLFHRLFREIAEPTSDTMRVLMSWLSRRPLTE